MGSFIPLDSSLRDVTNLTLPDVENFAPFGESIPLKDTHASQDFGSVLHTRRSRREFGPLTASPLISLLNRLVQPRHEWRAADGYIERQSPVPSAGGRQPLTIMVIASDISGLSDGVWMVRGDSRTALVNVQLPAKTVTALSTAAAAALRTDTVPPALIIPLARPRRTFSKYPGGESLLWRDAGALLAVAHLAAEDLGLASCILGLAETAYIPIPNSDEFLFDAGALAVGSRTEV